MRLAISGAERDEPAALARLAFDELGRAVGGIGDVHRAIAARAFAASGAGGAPARVVHDAIRAGVYAAVRGGAQIAGRGAALAVARGSGGAELSGTPAGASLLAVLNGLIGDELERDGSDLRQELSLRVGGRPVPPEPGELARAFPDARPWLVVFLHGLMVTEFAWKLGDADSYGSRLASDLGCTPIYLRYNTGRHVSENGRSLARLLDQVVEAWPVPVERIALVGHSMGGLVARSACHLASEDDAGWVRRVRHVVSLGSPHMGAPLAQGVHVASAALGALPETRAFSGFLRRRSAGIRDLRHGSLVDEDWLDDDPDALRARACREVPLLDGATHCFVTATVTTSEHHPLGRLIGDTLVLVPSASGRGRTRRIPFRDEDGLHVGGAHHLALLNHPLVYERLRDWLAVDESR